jgi:hypothetical protein
MGKPTADIQEHLKRCRENCVSRLSDPAFFDENSLQKNALRVEGLRDMSDRCGEKPPEHWSEGAKRRGWGMWVFSGGSASVFGHCELASCPRLTEFMRWAGHGPVPGGEVEG